MSARRSRGEPRNLLKAKPTAGRLPLRGRRIARAEARGRSWRRAVAGAVGEQVEVPVVCRAQHQQRERQGAERNDDDVGAVMEMVPTSSSMRRAAASMAGASTTTAETATARLPRSRTSDAAASSRPGARTTSPTSKPAIVKARAVARRTPALAPVITATFGMAPRLDYVAAGRAEARLYARGHGRPVSSIKGPDCVPDRPATGGAVTPRRRARFPRR